MYHGFLGFGCGECVRYYPQFHSSEYEVRRKGRLIKIREPLAGLVVETYYTCDRCGAMWDRKKCNNGGD